MLGGDPRFTVLCDAMNAFEPADISVDIDREHIATLFSTSEAQNSLGSHVMNENNIMWP